VHVDFKRPLEDPRGGVKNVEGSPSAIPVVPLASSVTTVTAFEKEESPWVFVPEVVWAVLVRHDNDGDSGVVLDRAYTVGRVGVVLLDVG
jgi:hypothetical protein